MSPFVCSRCSKAFWSQCSLPFQRRAGQISWASIMTPLGATKRPAESAPGSPKRGSRARVWTFRLGAERSQTWGGHCANSVLFWHTGRRGAIANVAIDLLDVADSLPDALSILVQRYGSRFGRHVVLGSGSRGLQSDGQEAVCSHGGAPARLLVGYLHRRLSLGLRCGVRQARMFALN